MRIHLESTTRTITVEEPGGGVVPARVWEGHTESGVKVICAITRIAVPVDADQSQFEAELIGYNAEPTPDGLAAFPARLIL